MVDLSITRQLAELGRIEFTEQELFYMKEDMKDIIGLMDKVCEFKDGEAYVQETVKYSKLRDDIPDKSYSTEDILKNAKMTGGNSFIVPKVV